MDPKKLVRRVTVVVLAACLVALVILVHTVGVIVGWWP